MTIPANPRPASTVILLRDAAAAAGPEVFLVRRHQETAFMGGAHVFPGGRVDDRDREVAEPSWCDGLDVAIRQLDSVPAVEAVAFHVAAIRELFEEAGVLLARNRSGLFVSLADTGEQARFRQSSADVHAKALSLRVLIDRENLRLALDALVPFAHWVTPPIDVRQFDTRFFVTRVPPRQTPIHDDRETTHSLWITPSDALAQAEADRIVLPPPTWTTLRELEPFRSVDDALAWSRARQVARRQPLLVEHEGVRMLVMPGDPLHPEPAVDPSRSELRFIHIAGRWRAQRLPT
jgi:8-oxo-dGTP pyrophosphatase MutT (NUDIX family)